LNSFRCRPLATGVIWAVFAYCMKDLPLESYILPT
jgi:hypothetical protein